MLRQVWRADGSFGMAGGRLVLAGPHGLQPREEENEEEERRVQSEREAWRLKRKREREQRERVRQARDEGAREESVIRQREEREKEEREKERKESKRLEREERTREEERRKEPKAVTREEEQREAKRKMAEEAKSVREANALEQELSARSSAKAVEREMTDERSDTEGRGKEAGGEEEDEEEEEEAAEVCLTLEVEMPSASHKGGFKKRLISDLAKACGMPARCFLVTSLAPGSVIARVLILPLESVRAALAVAVSREASRHPCPASLCCLLAHACACAPVLVMMTVGAMGRSRSAWVAGTLRLPASPGTLLCRLLTPAPPSVPARSRATPSVWLSSCLRAVLVRVLQHMAAAAVGRVGGGRMRCRRWKRHRLPGRC